MKNIEVELRGLISKEKVSELEKIFQKNGRFKEVKNRVLIDYSTYLQNEGIENRTKDIRLRVTNKIPEIIVKLGKWGGEENRKELSIPTKQGEFDKLVQIFGAIGLTKGSLCVRKIKVYDYKNVEFSLVEVPNHSYYFEAEKLIDNNDNEEKAKNEIKKICKELNLNLFNDDEFFQYVKKINKEVNEIFDFNNYKEDYFKNRFNL